MTLLRRVVIIDDDPELRFVLTQLLERHGGYDVVGAVDDAIEGLDVTLHLQPDIVILDLMMPSCPGSEVLPTLIRHCPTTMVAVLSALEGDADTESLLAAGAFAYYGKSQLPEVPALLDDDHGAFSAVLAGVEAVAPWRRRVAGMA